MVEISRKKQGSKTIIEFSTNCSRQPVPAKAMAVLQANGNILERAIWHAANKMKLHEADGGVESSKYWHQVWVHLCKRRKGVKDGDHRFKRI